MVRDFALRAGGIADRFVCGGHGNEGFGSDIDEYIRSSNLGDLLFCGGHGNVFVRSRRDDGAAFHFLDRLCALLREYFHCPE